MAKAAPTKNVKNAKKAPAVKLAASKQTAKPAASKKPVPTKAAAARQAPAKAATAKKAAPKTAPVKKALAPKAAPAKPSAAKPVAAKPAPVKPVPVKPVPVKPVPVKKEAAKKPVVAAKAAPVKKEAAKQAAPVKAPAPVKLPPVKKKTTVTCPLSGFEVKPEKPGLSPKTIERLRLKLVEERERHVHQADEFQAEAEQLANEREGGDTQFDEESGEGDTVNVARERDLLLSASARQIVDEIDRALERIKNKTYGVCAPAGRRISLERLDALPFAETCVECKARAERRR